MGLEMPYSVRFPYATAKQAPRCQSPKAEEQKAMASGSGELPVCGDLPATTAGELRGEQRSYKVGHHLTHEPIGKPYVHKGKQQPMQVAAIHSVSQRTTLANSVSQRGRLVMMPMDIIHC